MKKTIFLFAFILFVKFGYSQCPQPEVLSWHFEDSFNVEVSFFNQGNSGPFEIIFTAMYNDMVNEEIEVSETVLGECINGENTIQFNTLDLLNAAEIPLSEDGLLFDAARYYYKVDLRTTCNNDEWSEITSFYVSPYSMLNDAEFSCSDSLYMPLEFISVDFTEFVFEIVVEETVPQLDVLDMALFVDIGHTYNGDMDIRLTSPWGQTILLYDGDVGAEYYSGGFSCLFTDSGVQNATEMYAEVAPEEPLSQFYGNPMAGTWELRIIDTYPGIDPGCLFGACLQFNSDNCPSVIQGETYVDLDLSGTRDPNEGPMPYSWIGNTLYEEAIVTNEDGVFYRCTEPGVGELAVINTPQYYDAYPLTMPFEAIENQLTGDLDFAITPSVDAVDLSVHFLDADRTFSYYDSQYIVFYENMGTLCVDDITLKISLDHQSVTLLEVVDYDYMEFEEDIFIDLGTLCPMETGYVILRYFLQTDVEEGELIENSARLLTPSVIDETPHNNIDYVSSPAEMGSQARQKEVSDELINQDFLDNEEYLHYLIRFGTWQGSSIQHVIVTDTIDENLELNTFQLLDASHEVEVSIEDREITFLMKDVNLDGSDGEIVFLRYRIAPKQDIEEGTVIENIGYIQLDNGIINPTDIARTVVDFSSAVNNRFVETRVYPNPAENLVHIDWDSSYSISEMVVFDLLGKEVHRVSIHESASSESLDISSLKSGNYILKIVGDVPFKPTRFTKM